MIRKIAVSRELINETFSNHFQRAYRITNGIPEGYEVFKIDLERTHAFFWFAPSEQHTVDDSSPVIQTFDDPLESNPEAK